MAKRRLGEPMAVKHWSSAGLVLTWWCNARCASCYVCCGPERSEWMATDDALRWWGELADASPHGCRVHLTGGEPMGRWDGLLELCRRAQGHLGQRYVLEMVETNAFWATGAQVVRRRVRALDCAGMRRLKISTDPYHQQFVPISRCRLAAEVAAEVLGSDRVQVRWRDWLAEGFDTAGLAPGQLSELMAQYARKGRERLTGRAAQLLADMLPSTKVADLRGDGCRESLLRSRHVHVGPGGEVMPGTCAGILLGSARRRSIAEIWSALEGDWAERPIVAALARGGPVGLLDRARRAGFVPRDEYAGKCHLCWHMRTHLGTEGLHADELGPPWMYRTSGEGGRGNQQ